MLAMKVSYVYWLCGGGSLVYNCAGIVSLGGGIKSGWPLTMAFFDDKQTVIPLYHCCVYVASPPFSSQVKM